MTGPIEWPQLVAVLGVIATLVSLITVVASTRRTKCRDVADEAQGLQEMRGDLKYLVRGVDDVRVEQRRQGDEMRGVSERLTRVEESAKQAHKRLDGIERKGTE